MIVLIFASALVFAMYTADGDMDKLATALQVVTATLGGLVGSIIGYYFGESKINAVMAAGSQEGDEPGQANRRGTPPPPAPTPPPPPGSATPPPAKP